MANANRLPAYLFEALTPADVFEAVTRYRGRKPTGCELRAWVNQILGPFHIPADVQAKCAR